MHQETSDTSVDGAGSQNDKLGKPTTQFLDLPPELRLDVLDYIKDPSDLKSLCETCKVLNGQATVRLYRKMVIAVDKLNEELLRSCNNRNAGLKYVRKFAIEESWDVDYEESKHGVYVRHLLRLMPPDSLVTFWIGTLEGMSSENDDLLLQLQPNIPQLMLHAVKSAGGTPLTLSADKLIHVRCLSLIIESQDDVLRYCELLRNLHDLRTLDITARRLPSNITQTARVRSANVVTTLLNGYLSGATVFQGRRLDKLILDSFRLDRCEQVVTEFLHAACVEHLAFLNCKHTWKVFHELTFRPVGLRSLVDDDFELNRGPEPEMDTFLSSFKGLRELHRRYDPTRTHLWAACEGFSWAAIQNHADTLQILQIDDSLDEAHCWGLFRSISSFRQLCCKLGSLGQLNIRPPNANKDLWHAPDGFMAFLECLKQLKSLVSPRLNVRPDSMKDYDYTICSRALIPRATELEMQELADLVFSHIGTACPRLMALSLHASAPLGTLIDEDSINCVGFGFLRSTHTDQHGFAARPVPVESIKYHEPCCEIFEESMTITWTEESR